MNLSVCLGKHYIFQHQYVLFTDPGKMAQFQIKQSILINK